jgi:hypothetical protein
VSATLPLVRTETSGKRKYYFFRCACGKEVRRARATCHVEQCFECYRANGWRRARPREIGPGYRMGMLVLVERLPEGRCLVRCDCGGEKNVSLSNLRAGMTQSCGCQVGSKPVHGLSGTTEYNTWSGMMNRCVRARASKAWKYYGGRGIQVCKRWRESVHEFVADMFPRPKGRSIDRIDNDGHYSCGKCEECLANGWPANCRWATAKEQANNQRDACDSHYLEHDGRRLTCSQWARELGVSRQAIEIRIKNGWPVEKICTTRAPSFAKMLKGRVPGSRQYVHDGIRDNLAGWSRRTGIPWRVIHYRLKTGRSLAEAISPAFQRRPFRPRSYHRGTMLTHCRACGRTGHNVRTCKSRSGAA